MKIKQKNSIQLVLAENNLIVYFAAILFFLGGVYALYTKASPFVFDIPTGIFLIFIIVGIVLFITNKKVTFTFDTASGTLVIIQKTMLSKTEQTYQLSDITGVQLQNTLKRAPKGRGLLYGQIIQLVCKDAKLISFDTFSGTSSSSFKPGEKQRIISKEISNFLNVPFNELAAPALPTWGEAFELVRNKISEQINSSKINEN